ALIDVSLQYFLEKVGRAFDCTTDRLGFHIRECRDNSLARAPRSDVAAHGTSTDDVDMADILRFSGDFLQLVAEEKYPDQILRGFRNDKAREGLDLAVQHRSSAAAAFLPKINQRIRRGIMLGI